MNLVLLQPSFLGFNYAAVNIFNHICLLPIGKFFLYDGGLKRKSDNLLKTVEKICDNNLDGIIVSHPDADHIGGVIRIFEEHPQTCPVLLTTAFSTLQWKSLVQDLLQYLDKGQSLGNEDVHQSFLQSFNCFFLENAPGVLHIPLKQNERTAREPKTKKNVISNFANDSSIILQVKKSENEIYVCLTGDASGGQIVDHVKNKKMHAFLVSHHGSKHCSVLRHNDMPVINKLASHLSNYNILSGMSDTPGILNKWIKVPKCNRFLWRSGMKQQSNKGKKLTAVIKKVKDKITKNDKVCINNWSKSLLPKTRGKMFTAEAISIPADVQYIINRMEKEKDFVAQRNSMISLLKKELHTVRCKWFYDNVHSSTYIITCGQNSYGHPCKEVINGIALAAVERKEKCQIVITSSTGLDDVHSFSDVFFVNKDMVSVWYLDDSQNDENRPSCITINPLIEPFDVDSKKSPEGMKRLMFTKKPSNFSECTKCLIQSDKVNQILEAAKEGNKPKDKGDPLLPEYLKIIGHEGTITLFTLLKYILGFSVLNQLTNTVSLKAIDWNLLCEWQVNAKSNFNLSSTGVTVLEGEIHVHVPKHDQRVKEMSIKTVTITVSKPRTRQLELHVSIGFEGERSPERKSLLQNLDYNGSCGLPPAEYLAVIGADSKTCVDMVTGLSVGELLALLLDSTRATAMAGSFSDFFSTNLINYPIDPIQTIIDFQENHVAEAHVIANVPKNSHIMLTDNLHLQVQTALVHLFPSFDKSEQLIGLSGEVTVNGYRMTMKAFAKLIMILQIWNSLSLIP